MYFGLKNARLILVALLLIGVAILSVIVYKGESEKRQFKEDLVELSKIKYGLFNVDEWKTILEFILQKKIDEFNFDELPKEEIRKKVSDLLYSITGNLKSSFNEEKGFLPKAVANITGIFEKMDEKVPEFTATIMTFMEKPENREAIRIFALQKLDDLSDSTFSQVNYTTFDEVIEKYGCKDKDVVIAELNASIDAKHNYYKPFTIVLFCLAAIAAFILLFSKNLTKTEFLFLTMISICFLATGLTLPMIEIDARVTQMSFSLLGELILFKDQILYYKNKSIFEVVQVMIFQKRIDLLAVGFLVLLFSVLFPLAKLIASVFYVYSERVRNSNFMKFIVFRTGKWSMADVMVLAIFMAFIGFSGILRDQLKEIEIASNNLELFTTNESRLQVGFFMFMAFAVLSLLLAHKLQYEYKQNKNQVLKERVEVVDDDGKAVLAKTRTRKPRK